MAEDDYISMEGKHPAFQIKDSGERQEFDSGMVRDTAEDKINFVSLTFGPMLRRWADHLTRGRAKYPDPEPGVPNWTLAEGEEEYQRFRESAFRHFIAWLNGEEDEDHAAGVFFNINGAEYVHQKRSGTKEFVRTANQLKELDQRPTLYAEGDARDSSEVHGLDDPEYEEKWGDRGFP